MVSLDLSQTKFAYNITLAFGLGNILQIYSDFGLIVYSPPKSTYQCWRDLWCHCGLIVTYPPRQTL